MKKILNQLNFVLTPKRVSFTVLLLNISSIAFSIPFLIVQSYNILWDIFGFILLSTWFANLLLVHMSSRNINRKTKIGNIINLLSYFYLLFSILAMYIIIRANNQITATYSNNINDLGRWYGWIYTAIYGLLSLGVLVSVLNIKNLSMNQVKIQILTNRSKKILILKKLLKKLIALFCYISIATGILFAFIMILGSVIGLQPPEYYNDRMLYVIALNWVIGVIGMFIAIFGLAYAFVFLSAAILNLKVIDKRKNPKRYYSIGMTGVILAIIFMLPLCLTPYYVYTAEQNFTNAFGENWRKNIPKSIEEKYFLKTPFS
ncbi:MAG: hypothetical protein ACFFDK_11775, partial [Promethearchaeota archaeon]